MLKFHELEGKVKECIIYHYLGYRENNQWTYEEKEYKMYTKLLFDEKGKILQQANYFPDDSVSTFLQKYFYKKSGKLDYFLIIDEHTSLTSKGVFEYLNRRKIKEMTLYNYQNKAMGKSVYNYQKNQWTITTTMQQEDSGTFKEFYFQQFVHKNNGTLLSHEMSMADRQFHQITQHFYKDGEPLMYKSIVKNLIDNTETSQSYQYEFDQQGNWIKRYQFEKDKTYPVISIRKIEYFD